MHIFDVIVNEHIGKDDRHLLHRILENQYFIIQKLQNKMGLEEDFQAVINRIDGATNKIAQKLKDLADQIKGQGLPASIESQILLDLQGEASKLEGIGATDPVPTPLPEPTPEPTPTPEPVPEPPAV